MSFLWDTIGSGFDAVVALIVDFVVWLIMLLPGGSGIPAYVGDWLVQAWGWALSLDFLIGTSALPAVLAALIGFEIGLLTWHMLKWVAGLIRA